MSRTPDRSSPPGRRSWKQRGVSTGRHAPPTEFKHAGRWLLTLVLAVLLGIFIWFVWPERWGLRHLVVIPIGSTDQLILPPPAFAHEDAAALRSIPNLQVHDASLEALDATNLDTYLARTAELARSPHDVLFLYVSAHGGCDDGRAFLACSDFARDDRSGRYEVRRLLEHVASSPGQLKLVVMDAGRLDYDPRLGLVGNEFAARVVDEVQRMPPQDVWVLLSTGGSQVSSVSYADRRTVFGQAVADGLAGMANQPEQGGDGDAFVDLRELYDFTSQRCRNWFGEELPDYQTPILVQAGRGLDVDYSRLTGAAYRLLAIAPKSGPAADAPAPDGKSPEGKGSQDRPPTGTAPPAPAPSAAAPRASTPSAAAPGRPPASPASAQALPPLLLSRDVASLAAPASIPGPLAWLQPPASPSGAPPAAAPPGAPSASSAPVSTSAPPSVAPPPTAGPPAAAPPGSVPPAGSPAAAASAPPSAPPGSATAIPPAAAASPPAAPPPAGSAAAPPSAADAKRSPDDRLQSALQRLWDQRDKLHERQAAGRLAPLDFAPHLWREAEAWMVYYDARLRAGMIATAGPATADPATEGTADGGDARLLREIEVLTENLEQLFAAMNTGAMPAGRDEKSVGARLIDAWNTRYVRTQKGADNQFTREKPAELVEAREAVRGLHDLLYRAVDFVRWYGRAHTTLRNYRQFSEPIGTHLDSLAGLLGELRQMERGQPSAVDGSRLRQFVAAQRQQAAGQQELAAKIAAALREDATVRGRGHLEQRRMDDLLSTPLLSAAQRLPLRDALRRPAALATGGGATAAPVGPRPRPRVHFDWDRVSSCLALELRLVRWVDPNVAAVLERHVQTAQSDSRVLAREGGTGEANFWVSYRAAIAGLRGFYQGLRQPGPDEVALHLVDPRDVAAVDLARYPLPQFRLDLERPASLRIEPLAADLRLEPPSDLKLSVTLVASRRSLLDSRVEVTNADQLLVMEALPESQELPPVQGQFRRTMHWRVTPRPGGLPENRPATSIQLAANYAGQQAVATVRIDLPQPNRVDVALSRAGIPEDYPDAGDTTLLRLFTNRTTKFVCSLINRHDRDKTVEVYLYAVAPQPQRFSQVRVGRFDPAIRRAVYDDAARVFLEGKLIAQTAKPMVLKAADPDQVRELRTPVEFVRPAGGVPPPPAANAPAQPPTAPPPPPPEPLHGLVLKIVDVNDRQREWLQWIELAPLAPREYLDAQIGYDQQQRQITARFRPKMQDARGRPALPGGNPIDLVWDPSGADLPEQGKRLLTGKLDAAAPNPETLLSAEAPPDDKLREVKIGVDGIPRAFYYRVPCTRNPAAPPVIRGDDLARERTAIRIESVSVPQQLKVYHYPPHLRRPLPRPDEKGPKVEHIDLASRQPALFAAPAEMLLVHLQADAPLDAFTNDTDGIQVMLEVNNLTRNLRATRDFEASLVQCGSGGMIELQSRVSDLTVPLEIGSLLNAEASVITTIRFGELQQTDRVDVLLDGDTPAIRGLELPRTVPKGAPVNVTFRSSDYSGIAKVVYGLSRDGSLRLDDATAITRIVETTRDEAGRHVCSIALDTKDLAPGRHLLVAKVVDQVGRESELASREFQLVEPMVAPAKFEIRGRIRAGRASVSGNLAEMTVEGGELGLRPVPIQPDGSFLISDVKPGEYTLKAKGFVGNRERSKELKVKATDVKLRVTQDIDLAG